MECLSQSGYESGACRQRAMAYLQCRMERQAAGAEGQPRGPGTGRRRGRLRGVGGVVLGCFVRGGARVGKRAKGVMECPYVQGHLDALRGECCESKAVCQSLQRSVAAPQMPF